MARNFNGTADTNGTTLTIDGSFAYKVYVKNTGSVELQVNVPRVHGASDYDRVAAGDTGVYESKGDIRSINVQTAASTTTYTAGVIGGTA